VGVFTLVFVAHLLHLFVVFLEQLSLRWQR
jgi:hypothetical protein